jgi:hypothetical protein
MKSRRRTWLPTARAAAIDADAVHPDEDLFDLSHLSRLIADLRASGAASLRDLAAGLDAAGIPTPRGGSWSPVQVSRVLDRLATPANA